MKPLQIRDSEASYRLEPMPATTVRRDCATAKDRLRAAITDGDSFAFETTLGGRSVTATLIEATRSHEVLI
jgi:predicted ABC-type ATPase